MIAQHKQFPPPDRDKRKANGLDELQSAFIQNVSHELRTPLTIIQGYAELLSDGSLGALAPEQQEAIFVIVDRTSELRTLVERVGVLMAIEAHTGEPVPTTLDEVIAEVMMKKARAAAIQAGLTLEIHLEPNLPPVSGDPYHLEQAIGCLLDNAIKFTPCGGQVKVQTYTESGWVCLAVTDTGIGMTEEELEHLFTRFYQADTSTTRRYKGIGLGLTLAKAVIEEYGGQIQVESQPSQGSRFTVRLPALLPMARAAQPREGEGTLRRILIVDDEETVARTLQNILKKLPYCETAVATSGEQALRLFEAQPFDLLITDYKMPGMDGMSLAARIRQLYPRTAVIMITAYSNEELREQAARVAIQGILDKPVELVKIRNAALEVLDGSETCQIEADPARQRGGWEARCSSTAG